MTGHRVEEARWAPEEGEEWASEAGAEVISSEEVASEVAVAPVISHVEGNICLQIIDIFKMNLCKHSLTPK